MASTRKSSVSRLHTSSRRSTPSRVPFGLGGVLLAGGSFGGGEDAFRCSCSGIYCFSPLLPR